MSIIHRSHFQNLVAAEVMRLKYPEEQRLLTSAATVLKEHHNRRRRQEALIVWRFVLGPPLPRRSFVVHPKRAVGIASKERRERKEEKLESKQCRSLKSPDGGAAPGRESTHKNLLSVLFAFFRGQFNRWTWDQWRWSE